MKQVHKPLTGEERERAKLMHASGKTPSAIAKSMGRSHHTLQKYLRKPDTQELVSIQRQELAGMFDHVAQWAVASVTEEDMKKANLVQKMTSAGIAVDKAELLRNGPMPQLNVNLLIGIMEVLRNRREDRSVILEANLGPTLPANENA